MKRGKTKVNLFSRESKTLRGKTNVLFCNNNKAPRLISVFRIDMLWMIDFQVGGQRGGPLHPRNLEEIWIFQRNILFHSVCKKLCLNESFREKPLSLQYNKKFAVYLEINSWCHIQYITKRKSFIFKIKNTFLVYWNDLVNNTHFSDCLVGFYSYYL